MILKSVLHNKQIMLPIKIVIVFVSLTILLFFWGPIDWEINHPVILFVYLASAVFLLSIGYFCGASKEYLKNNDRRSSYEQDAGNTNSVRTIFYFLIITYTVAAFFTLASRTGSWSLNLSAFNNIGAAYYSRGETNLLYERILILLAPFTMAFIPYGMFNLKKISKLQQFLLIVLVIFRTLVDMTQGINKTFADVIIIILLYSIINIARPSLFDSKGYKRFKKWLIRIGIVSVLALFLFFLFFSANILSRTLNDTSDKLKGLNYLVSYFTEGYKAVDYTLDQPFTSTFGLGNSMYLLDNSKKYFGNAIYSRSYIYKNEVMYGWNGHVNWSSIFVWIANDVSLIGVLPVLFGMGYLFGKSFVNALYQNNDFSSVVISGLLFQAAIYIPANNQIVQLQPAFIGLWCWLFIYWYKHGKFRFVIGKR